MEEYRDEFLKLFLMYRKTYNLSYSVTEGWTKVAINVMSLGKVIVSVHEEADRPLRYELWYEDDHEESERMRNIAYYKAYNSLKSWIDSTRRSVFFGGREYG